MANNKLMLHPLTGEPIRPVWIRPDGRVMWPVLGGDDTVEPVVGSGTGSGSGDPKGLQAPASTSDGFPANTPVEQMTGTQREAYWRHQAQSWQGRAKGNFAQLQELGVKSAEDIAAIKDKVSKHDALEFELLSDKDKAVAAATEDAFVQSAAVWAPKLVAAKLEAAAARQGVNEESLSAALQFVDAEKFLKDGEVDTAKVTAFVQSIAPAKGTPPKGPLIYPAGIASGTSGQPGDQGKAMAKKRFGEKK